MVNTNRLGFADATSRGVRKPWNVQGTLIFSSEERSGIEEVVGINNKDICNSPVPGKFTLMATVK